MYQTVDVPQNKPCAEVNPSLFVFFQKAFFAQTHNLPGYAWTEQNVVQWLDTEFDNKYLDELDSENQNTW